MNWYKRAKKEPWQMTREEYNSVPYPPLKPNKVMSVMVGNHPIEVVQNPTGSDMRQMTRESKREFPHMPLGTPTLRFTQDFEGNKYCWKAYEGVHASIEPILSKMVGVELNQNADRPIHSRVIYDALESGKAVPENVFNEFAQKYPEVAQNYELV